MQVSFYMVILILSGIHIIFGVETTLRHRRYATCGTEDLRIRLPINRFKLSLPRMVHREAVMKRNYILPEMNVRKSRAKSTHIRCLLWKPRYAWIKVYLLKLNIYLQMAQLLVCFHEGKTNTAGKLDCWCATLIPLLNNRLWVSWHAIAHAGTEGLRSFFEFSLSTQLLLWAMKLWMDLEVLTKDHDIWCSLHLNS